MSTSASRDALALAVGVPLALGLASGVVQLLPPPAAARTSAVRPHLAPIPMPVIRPAGPRYLLAAAAAGTVAS